MGTAYRVRIMRFPEEAFGAPGAHPIVIDVLAVVAAQTIWILTPKTFRTDDATALVPKGDPLGGGELRLDLVLILAALALVAASD